MIRKKQNIKKCLLIIIYCSLNACTSNKSVQTTSYYKQNYETGNLDQRTGLGFQKEEKFPIEVLIGDDKPQTEFAILEKLTISDESSITSDQVYKDKMLKRGNNEQEKKALLDRMVAQAQDLGASGLMNVNYKVFSTQKTTGYVLSGTAFKYVIQK